MANESAATGVAELDRALDGLYWGDNVVWVWESGELSSQELFYDAIAQRRDDFGRTGYVIASSDPAEITARWPWLEIIDARKGTPITSPRHLLEAVHRFCAGAPRALLPDAARPRRDRLLVGAGGEPVPEHAPRDRADHPVHPRRRRGPPAHQQGRGPPAGSPGPAVPLLRQARGAATGAGPGG